MKHVKIQIQITAPRYNTCGQTPSLTCYCMDACEPLPDSDKRPAVVICPGGGYGFVSEREAEPIAFKYLSLGFNCFVLTYSVAPARYPTALMELAYSIAYLRNHAEALCIDPNQIAVVGFSAGGHLAASLSVFWNHPFLAEALQHENAQFMPNATILSYPVITSDEYAHHDSFKCALGEAYDDAEMLELLSLEKQVTEDTPPTFLWHTFEDALVPVENSLLYASALRKHNIPFELHIYQRGGHGLSLANEITGSVLPECQEWLEQSARWMCNLYKGA